MSWELSSPAKMLPQQHKSAAWLLHLMVEGAIMCMQIVMKQWTLSVLHTMMCTVLGFSLACPVQQQVIEQVEGENADAKYPAEEQAKSS